MSEVDASSYQNDGTEPVSQGALRAQAYKVWWACILWPVWLFVLPGLWSFSPWLGLVWIVFPGIWCYCWLGVLMHEASHGYFPSLNNRLAYKILSLNLFMDPQVFLATHATHHVAVNTWDDRQIHPLGKIENRAVRRVFTWLEILLGDIYFIVAGTFAMWRDPALRRHYRPVLGLVWNLTWMVGLAVVLSASAQVFQLSFWQTLGPVLLGVWACALVLRHNELVQHAGLIVEGDLATRNLATRNLAPTGLASKLFLFLTHDDPAQHVLHHTLTSRYSRPFKDHFALPDGSVFITLPGYFRLLGRLLKGPA